MDNTFFFLILPSLRWSLQQISCLHLTLSVVCSSATPNICPLNLHVHESSLLLRGNSNFIIFISNPSILLIPSKDLNIFSLASGLFVGVTISKRYMTAGPVGFPFTPAASPTTQQNICLCAVHLHLDFSADILTNPLSMSTCHMFVEMHLYFCFVGKCNISVCTAHFCALETVALGQIIHFVFIFFVS